MSEYRVQLDEFTGPLDLLLYLVRRNELDIINLAISEITGQFLTFLEVLEMIDLDVVGDFIVMASTLVEIKSRLVLPRAEETAEEEVATEDPRSELIEQLLQYKRYKDAANALDAHATEWQQRYPRLSDERPARGAGNAAEDTFREVELWDLVSALSRVLQKKVVEETSSIKYDDTPISTYVERIGARVREAGRVPFSEFFEGAALRSKIIGIFLAVLELLRHHSFRAEQPIDYGDIYLLPPLPPAADETTPPEEAKPSA